MAPKENIKGPGIHTEELALFSKPPVNVGEEKISWVEYHPTFMSSGEYSSVQFHIPGIVANILIWDVLNFMSK